MARTPRPAPKVRKAPAAVSLRRKARVRPVKPSTNGNETSVDPSAVAEAFTVYWQNVQSGQASVLTSTRDAYTELLKGFEATWDLDVAKERFAAELERFAARARETADSSDEALEEAYREYLEGLRDAWADPQLSQPLEEAALAYSETVQKAADDAQEQSRHARRQYLLALKEKLSKLDLENLDADSRRTISRNMMMTAFFTDGVRSENS